MQLCIFNIIHSCSIYECVRVCKNNCPSNGPSLRWSLHWSTGDDSFRTAWRILKEEMVLKRSEITASVFFMAWLCAVSLFHEFNRDYRYAINKTKIFYLRLIQAGGAFEILTNGRTPNVYVGTTDWCDGGTDLPSYRVALAQLKKTFPGRSCQLTYTVTASSEIGF